MVVIIAAAIPDVRRMPPRGAAQTIQHYHAPGLQLPEPRCTGTAACWLRYLALERQRCTAGSTATATARATSVPERAGNCGHQRSLTDIANGLRSGHGLVDPLRETYF
jgi:hypothetical protein